MTTRLLLVDDHAVVRSGLRMLLESQAGLEIVGEAGTGHEALKLVNELQPDIVLMDIGLPDMSGIEVTRQIKQQWPAALRGLAILLVATFALFGVLRPLMRRATSLTTVPALPICHRALRTC